MPQIVSANRLTDGIVVFLGQGDQWVENFRSAALLADKPALEAGLARAQDAVRANIVVEVAPMDVAETPHGLEPKHIRDRIRAEGPTVRLDHGKQAAHGA